MLYKAVLEERGHTVDVARDGEEGVRKYMIALKDAQEKKGRDDEDRSADRDGNRKRTITTTIRTDVSSSQGISSQEYTNHSSLHLPLVTPFDAVILDYKMPRKDGLEVAKHILAANPAQRIIFASAYVKETLRESVRELRQVIELVQKPFLPQVLVDIVEDSEAYPELKKLFVNVSKMTEIDFENPTPDQIRGIFEGLKKIQRGRTF
jgi:CheY-like chemotaxis protein